MMGVSFTRLAKIVKNSLIRTIIRSKCNVCGLKVPEGGDQLALTLCVVYVPVPQQFKKICCKNY